MTMSAEDYSLPDPPAGLLHWSFRVSTERPLLTREQRKMWNPLVINTRKVRCLPGVMLETNNPSMMKYMQPTRFSLLAKYCEPIFATIKFPPYPIDGFQRIIRTCALPQVNTPPVLQGSVSGERSNEESQGTAGQRTARSARSTLSRSSKTSKKRTAVVDIDKSRRDADFHCKSVFLTAFMNKFDLINQIENSQVTFELHDRDIMIDDDKKQKMLDGWEEALSGVAEAGDEEGGETNVDVFGQGEQAWKDILAASAKSAKSMRMALQSFD